MFNIRTNKSALAELSGSSLDLKEVLRVCSAYFYERSADGIIGRFALTNESPVEVSLKHISFICPNAGPQVGRSPYRRRLVQSKEPIPTRKGGGSLEEGAVSIYQRLVEYGLLDKVTEIVMAKLKMPWHLKDDAEQEVHTTWVGLTSKPEFAQNQVARYAYMSGQHAALRLRRSLGAVVYIPGSLFITGRDTPFMESIGAAVNPHNIDDLQDLMDISVGFNEFEKGRLREDYVRLRLANLTLTQVQRDICLLLIIEQKSPLEVARELNVTPCEVERTILQIATRLEASDTERERVTKEFLKERNNGKEPARIAVPVYAASNLPKEDKEGE